MNVQDCPACGKAVAVNKDGSLHKHKTHPYGPTCAGNEIARINAELDRLTARKEELRLQAERRRTLREAING